MPVSCPLCCQKQELIEARIIFYPTSHPLFAPCQIISCQFCHSGWVPNAPDIKALKEFYETGIFGDKEVIRFLSRSWVQLARCQSLARWHFILKSLRGNGANFFDKKISVCDIGAGYGTTLEAGKFLKLSLDYFGFESSVEMRRRIHTLGGQTTVDFFCEREKKKFDLVWASHILEHYPNPDDFLQRMHQIMIPGGAGFLEVPCLDYEFKPEVTQHLLFFSMEGLKTTLERNGFQVLQIEEVGKRRQEMKQEFEQMMGKPSIRAKFKRLLPNPMIKMLRSLYSFSRYSFVWSDTNLQDDFSAHEVFEKWGLESYGSGRCWIRAVFVPACH